MPASYNTRAIVMRNVKYGESSLVVQCYTQQKGMQSYLLRGVRKSKARLKAGLFQPLQVVEMHCAEGKSRDLHYVRNINALGGRFDEDVRKNSVRMLLNEIILKCIRESEANEEMYAFLEAFLLWFDACREGCHNAYLSFLLEFSKRIGFASAMKHRQDEVFYIDLYEGCSSIVRPGHKAVIDPPLSSVWHFLSERKYDRCGEIHMNGRSRAELLNYIVDYFVIHVPGFGSLKSLEVLQAVLH